jgi:hypothetical protein
MHGIQLAQLQRFTAGRTLGIVLLLSSSVACTGDEQSAQTGNTQARNQVTCQGVPDVRKEICGPLEELAGQATSEELARAFKEAFAACSRAFEAAAQVCDDDRASENPDDIDVSDDSIDACLEILDRHENCREILAKAESSTTPEEHRALVQSFEACVAGVEKEFAACAGKLPDPPELPLPPSQACEEAARELGERCDALRQEADQATDDARKKELAELAAACQEKVDEIAASCSSAPGIPELQCDAAAAALAEECQALAERAKQSGDASASDCVVACFEKVRTLQQECADGIGTGPAADSCEAVLAERKRSCGELLEKAESSTAPAEREQLFEQAAQCLRDVEQAYMACVGTATPPAPGAK